jgi:hypothetical protein
MLNIKQREEGILCWRNVKGFEELAFAVEHKKPWQLRAGSQEKSTPQPAKNMATMSACRSLGKRFVVPKMLNIPCGVRAR